MRRRRSLAAVLALVVLAGGCSGDGGAREARGTTGGGLRASGSVDVTTVLDHPPAPLLDLADGLPDLLDTSGRLRRRAAADLDRKLARPAAPGPAAGRMRPAAFVPATTDLKVPGVQLPVTAHGTETSTSNDAGATRTTTVTADSAIADQVLTSSVTTRATEGDPAHPKAVLGTDVSTKVRLCQPADATTVEVETRLLLSGGGAESVIESTGTYVQGADGLVDVVRVDVVVTRTTASGAPPTVEKARATRAGWDPRGHDTVLEDSTFSYPSSGGGLTQDQWAAAVTHAGLLATDALKAALSEARRRTEQGGICVVLTASADRSTLSPGEQARIDVEVVDPRTGSPVDGAVVAGGWGGGGVFEPDSVPAPGTLTFKAVGTPDYAATLIARTPRGGDIRTVHFDGPGWRFEGVSYDATAPGSPGAIPVTTTWSGRACGDPFTATWEVEVTFSSPVASHTIALEDTATRLEDAPATAGARLLIAEKPPSEDGGPSFRLWVDDENPAIRPSHHRVEVVDLEPVEGACVS